MEIVVPRVSVIIVTFNQGPALRRCVTALQHSKAREQMEIVVVDCGSTDGSTTLDTDFPSVNLMRLPHHLGAVRAMNIATRTAKADLLLYLSPDVEVGPDTVAALADRLESTTEAFASGNDDTIALAPQLVDTLGKPVARAYRIPDAATLAAIAKTGGSLTTVAIDDQQESAKVEALPLDALMIRKVFIRGMNYFDQRFGQYWPDTDLAMQARKAGKSIRIYPTIRAVYHPAPDPLAGDSILPLDRAVGAAELIGKYQGSGAAFKFRLSLALGALTSFNFGLFSGIIGGVKLDGGQRS
ncbi:MAG: glycosyltransferase [Acidobacteriota bacterium]